MTTKVIHISERINETGIIENSANNQIFLNISRIYH